MSLGRRSFNLRSRRDSIQKGLGPAERSREKAIRTKTGQSHKKKKKKVKRTGHAEIPKKKLGS